MMYDLYERSVIRDDFEAESAGFWDGEDPSALNVFDDESDDEFDMQFDDEFDAQFDDEIDYQIIGTDTRKRVRKQSAVPWRYICSVQVKIRGRWMANGTGTLIGPRTLLTAGHVIENNHGFPMRIVPAASGSVTPFGTSRVSKRIYFPGYVAGTSTDIGLMHLTRPLGAKAGYWSSTLRKTKVDVRGTAWFSGDHSKLKKVNLSGYPNDRPFVGSWKCRSGPQSACGASSPWSTGRNRKCGTYQYWAFNKIDRVASGLMLYQNDTCVGHSGSPLWLSPRGKARRLVAVHIAARGSSANAGVPLTAAKRKWIRARIK